MELTTPLFWGHLISIGFLAMALGLDALSLGLGIGMKGIRKLHVIKIGFVTALFHMILPLAGMWTGSFLGALLGRVAAMCGGALLIFLGAHMIYNLLKAEETRGYDHRRFWGLMLFSFSVSVDSFSVGISLGMFSGDVLLTVLMFGAAGGLMSMMGLLLGNRVGAWFGEYGEMLGGVILIAFGIRIFL